MNKFIKIYQGNCLEVLPTINLDKVIFVSDPPYNVGYHYDSYHDKLDEDEYLDFLSKVFGDKPQVLIHYPEFFHLYSIYRGKAPTKVISWVYNCMTPRQHRSICYYDVEPDFNKIGQPYKNPNDSRVKKRIADGKMSRLYDWWEIQQVKNISRDKTIVPCQIPFEVMRRTIGVLPDDYTIVDPFLGSGTTALACIELKRNFIGIELSEDYYRVAKSRIKDFIGLNFDNYKMDFN